MGGEVLPLGTTTMIRKSHYTVLGIPSDESQEGIRSAYLRLVKSLHPDHAGESGTSAFREVQNAYDVLSDPERRGCYDHQLHRKRIARTWNAEPLTGHGPVEPLMPDRSVRAPAPEMPSFILDGLLEHFFTGFTPMGTDLGPSPEVMEVDVILSAGQALRGGDFTIRIPIREICRVCAGRGYHWPFSCAACGETGWTVREREVRLSLPPGIRHGTVVHLRPEHAGGSALRVRLLTERRMWARSTG